MRLWALFWVIALNCLLLKRVFKRFLRILHEIFIIRGLSSLIMDLHPMLNKNLIQNFYFLNKIDTQFKLSQ